MIMRLLAFCIVCSVLSVHADDLTITAKQKEKLKQLKEIVEDKATQPWMKQDVYWLRFLKERNFDVRKAADRFIAHLKWRKEFKMDTIHEENWKDMEKDYPVYTDGVDKKGQPICAFEVGEWDVRKSTLNGKLPRVIRWVLKCRDLAFTRAMKMMSEGKNITQWSFISNMNGVNQKQHLCIQCMPLYTVFATAYDVNYPYSADIIMLINTPQVFEIVMSIIRPLLHPSTRDALQIYGKNKAEWDSKLFSKVNRDQLPTTFGGTRIYS